MLSHPYLPHTEDDIREMLRRIGVDSIESLFDTVPETARYESPLDLPDGKSEWAVDRYMAELAGANAGAEARYFYGAGSYDHHIPAAVRALASRSEFVTAYTPYQPEVSQGTLQAIYEFQTMVTELTGMDIATASHYDGATALAEALLITLRKSRSGDTVAVSSLVHPAHRQVIRTYLEPAGFRMVVIPAGPDGRTDPAAAEKFLSENTGRITGIAVQSPNFFGNVEDLGAFRTLADSSGAMLVASFSEALSLGLLKSPGSFGADLVAGEGQSLGLSRNFGGPGLGILAGTAKQMRNLPGRLVGKTSDTDGERGYVLTLATREQHIRREKASSNICSNNGLNALTAAIWMAAAGKNGIRILAEQNRNHAFYLREGLTGAGFTPAFDVPFFNEFVMKAPAGFPEVRDRLAREKNIHAGLPLEKWYPEMAGHYLFCATETVSREDMDGLVREVQA